MPRHPNPDVLVGYETADDAGVFRIDEERALVQTLDFFTPVVDDPYVYGSIAAANSLSDVYAMGGKPLTALAITCFPEKDVEMSLLGQIMRGGLEKLTEAEVALIGGHTVKDSEIKFGYSITGLVHPKRIVTNAGARPGDALVLTKPLGIGLLTSGVKLRKTSASGAQEAINVMTALNRTASEVMLRHDCHAATDVTGNGLLGHAYEMAVASGVTLRFAADRIPYIPEAYSLAKTRYLPKTIASTWTMIAGSTRFDSHVPDPLRNILLDPQTSGGLLISLNSENLDAFLADIAGRQVEARHIGTVEELRDSHILVEQAIPQSL